MTQDSNSSDGPTLDDVPGPDDVVDVSAEERRTHGGMPLRPDDEALERRVAQERVDAGLEPYDPDTVPDAEDPVPDDETA